MQMSVAEFRRAQLRHDAGMANKGKTWEQVCADALDLAQTQGHLSWFRVPEARVVLRTLPDGKQLCIQRSEALPDLHVCLQGRSILLDWKEVKSDRLAFAHVTATQAECLTTQARRGGGAGLLAEAGAGAWWVLDWRSLGPLWMAWDRARKRGQRAKPGTASLRVDDFEAHGWAFDVNTLPGALRRLVEAR